MIIAIPLEDGKLAPHFGHCASFALIETDAANAVTERRDIDAPPHEPGLLPVWLAERGVTLVICGGMGARALDLFAQKGIEVVSGAPVDTPERLAAAYLHGQMETTANGCSHHDCDHD
ncbi:NifB/NifX family molybdenum-iron cluster-binding protein [Rhodomicrobium sp. Az07]|uniref:NifB/NifX family molybdenum-iron cluster-binding protein n=1 Tax=Rhodomicrobium sp. Az07 TaxID=2839034 RepID=UPI001BE82A4A|nr:NifB/NifX family molybdenum-iron cluster-binding protein [Rhodomicrobium sp. Az07]MBT3070725.1 NifB/NifX family molybdenum-iron cluster-binding protein [Rhodomicrobium sp. Az07]